jgi:hypothetical protein
MLPDGSSPRVHEHENYRPAGSLPWRRQSRTSIDLQDSQVLRPPKGHRDKIHPIDEDVGLATVPLADEKTFGSTELDTEDAKQWARDQNTLIAQGKDLVADLVTSPSP